MRIPTYVFGKFQSGGNDLRGSSTLNTKFGKITVDKISTNAMRNMADVLQPIQNILLKIDRHDAVGELDIVLADHEG
jgi:hypothetical protein